MKHITAAVFMILVATTCYAENVYVIVGSDNGKPIYALDRTKSQTRTASDTKGSVSTSFGLSTTRNALGTVREGIQFYDEIKEDIKGLDRKNEVEVLDMCIEALDSLINLGGK